MTIRFVAVGHVTNDRLDAGLLPGGSALYAALTAAELGAKTRIVTSHGPDFVGGRALEAAGVGVVNRAADTTTCFENRYVGEARKQRVLSIAERLDEPVEGNDDVIFLCPVIGEVGPRAIAAPPGVILGASLQGWMRDVGPDGTVLRRALDPGRFAPCHVLFASVEDLGEHAEDLIPRLVAVAQIVVITEGARGARIYREGKRYRVHAHPAREVDPTGAGDVFAAAFLVALGKREPPLAAGVVAACAASIAVEEHGPAALVGLGALASRIAWYRRHVPLPSPE